jgi:hypothetical protein
MRRLQGESGVGRIVFPIFTFKKEFLEINRPIFSHLTFLNYDLLRSYVSTHNAIGLHDARAVDATHAQVTPYEVARLSYAK